MNTIEDPVSLIPLERLPRLANLTLHYTVYCSRLGHKAKQCFRFTRYLPGISLNEAAEAANKARWGLAW
jgi:hypothetical protein